MSRNIQMVTNGVLVVIATGLCTLYFLKQPSHGNDGGCLTLWIGTANVQVPSIGEYESIISGGTIRLFKKGDLEQFREDARYVIRVGEAQGSWPSSSVEDIINASMKDNPPGPQYNKKVMFGQIAAAFAEASSTDGDLWDYFQIPFQNRIIEIDAHISAFTNEKSLKDVLGNIKFSKVADNADPAVVTVCN